MGWVSGGVEGEGRTRLFGGSGHLCPGVRVLSHAQQISRPDEGKFQEAWVLLDLRELRTFKGQVVHQSLVAEYEGDDRLVAQRVRAHAGAPGVAALPLRRDARRVLCGRSRVPRRDDGDGPPGLEPHPGHRRDDGDQLGARRAVQELHEDPVFGALLLEVPTVPGVEAFGESSVNYQFSVWAKSENWLELRNRINTLTLALCTCGRRIVTTRTPPSSFSSSDTWKGSSRIGECHVPVAVLEFQGLAGAQHRVFRIAEPRVGAGG